jgi:hypothetical protein
MWCLLLCGWLSGMPTNHPNRITSTKCHINTVVFSWWWAHSRPKHVEIYKYTKNKYAKNKLCIEFALFKRFYSDARSTKHKIKLCNLHTQRRIFSFHIFSNNDITYVLNKSANTFYILIYVQINSYRLLARPIYTLSFVGLDNSLVNTNLIFVAPFNFMWPCILNHEGE